MNKQEAQFVAKVWVFWMYLNAAGVLFALLADALWLNGRVLAKSGIPSLIYIPWMILSFTLSLAIIISYRKKTNHVPALSIAFLGLLVLGSVFTAMWEVEMTGTLMILYTIQLFFLGIVIWGSYHSKELHAALKRE